MAALARPSPRLCPQEMVDWFNALRAARFHYLQVAFPGASNADVSGRAPCDPGRDVCPRPGRAARG